MQTYFKRLGALGIKVTSTLKETIESHCGRHPYLLEMLGATLEQLVLSEPGQKPDLKDALQMIEQPLFEYVTELIELMRNRQKLDKLLQIVVGPDLDVRQSDIIEFCQYGLIKQEPSTNFDKTPRYVAFCTPLQTYLSVIALDKPIWSLWTQTEDVLRTTINSTLRNVYCSDWMTKFARERREFLCDGEGNSLFQRCLNAESYIVRQGTRKPSTNLLCHANSDELFALIFAEWEHFRLLFGGKKEYWRKCADHLIRARYSYTHTNGTMVYQADREQIEHYCQEIIQLLHRDVEPDHVRERQIEGISRRLPYVGGIVDNKYVINAMMEPTDHSQVVKAWDEKLQRAVAIKFLLLHPNKEQRAELQRRLDREGQILAKLMKTFHKNVGGILAALPEYPAIVTPWFECKECSFEEMVQNENLQLPPARIVSIGIQLADALDRIHQQDIVHRDIKPSNILFNEAGDPVLIDFDIARASDFGTITSSPDDYVGSPYYSAPEQFEHSGSVRFPADIFALGVVLYQALTHRYPYPDGNDTALYETGQFPELPAQHTIPEVLHKILCDMLNQYPNKRPKAGEVRKRLRMYLTQYHYARKRRKL